MRSVTVWVACLFVTILFPMGVQAQGFIKTSCECPVGTELISKFEVVDNEFVFEKPTGNEDVVSVSTTVTKDDGEPIEGVWTSSQPIDVIVVKSSNECPPVNTTNQFSGTFVTSAFNGNGQPQGISNIQFCGGGQCTDTTLPTLTLGDIMGDPGARYREVTFSDEGGSGIVRIEFTKLVNITVTDLSGLFESGDGKLWTLKAGETAPSTAVFTFAQTNPNNPNASYFVEVEDQCGNTVLIDPALAWFEDTPPVSFYLEENYPNPFNPSTTIRFHVIEASQVNITVYDLTGRAIRTLVSHPMEAGIHEVVWDGTSDVGVSVSSGTYLYRMTAGSFSATKTMILVK